MSTFGLRVIGCRRHMFREKYDVVSTFGLRVIGCRRHMFLCTWSLLTEIHLRSHVSFLSLLTIDTIFLLLGVLSGVVDYLCGGRTELHCVGKHSYSSDRGGCQ